jgi:hypothetical protein
MRHEAIVACRHLVGEKRRVRVVEAAPGQCFRAASAPTAVVPPDAVRGIDRERVAPLRGCIGGMRRRLQASAECGLTPT